MLLIIDISLKNAKIHEEIFHYMGVLSEATTPEHALNLINQRYRAVLLLRPDTLPDLEDYLTRLRAYAGRTPLFALTDSEAVKSSAALFDGVFADNIYSSRLVEEILQYQRQHDLPLIADYRLAGIDACPQHKEIRYFDEPLALTKTEAMILRFLIRAYPLGSSAREIMAQAYRPSRMPELSNVRTHVSMINKKFRQISGQNMIQMIPHHGYVILTPQLRAEWLRPEAEDDAGADAPSAIAEPVV